MIDLRSDTVTRPTEPMRAAMATAEVGDDVYGEDPTVRALEAAVAELLGKEDAVFVPTGTMSNQLGVRVHTEHGDRALLDVAAHIARSEGGGAAALSGVSLQGLPGRRGVFTPHDVDAAVGVRHAFMPTTVAPPARLLCVENTHNGGGGAVWPLEALRDVCDAGRRHGLALHLDGARLWHATAASGIAERDFAEPFDTVNVCFSKGLGAPVGSALAGRAEVVSRARRFKQQFGGGMRQAGVLAAGALYALRHHRAGLVDDVRNARTLAEGLAAEAALDVDLEGVQSNIVVFSVRSGSAATFVERCHRAGVFMLPWGATGVRAVLHRDVGAEEVARALQRIGGVLEAADPG